MKANELRIGNLMNFPFTNEIVEIIGINAHESIDLQLNKTIINTISFRKNLNLYCEPIDKIEPIPLTEEWLNKLGFELNGFYRLQVTSFLELCWKPYDKTLNLQTKKNGFTEDSKVKYVHELQNLYFALTGKEITLKKQ
jgi:hypothetical protein